MYLPAECRLSASKNLEIKWYQPHLTEGHVNKLNAKETELELHGKSPPAD